MTDDEKSPAEQAIDQALDVFVYAPIGLIFDGPALFPKLVEKGRSQATMAKMIGRFAVQQGQAEATKALGKLGEQAGGLLDLLGDRSSPAPSTPAPAAPRPPAPEAAAPQAPSAAAPLPDELAIPDYDSLSASQVVSRLGGLERTELDSVRAYEAAKRGRKTILNKIAQLQRA